MAATVLSVALYCGSCRKRFISEIGSKQCIKIKCTETDFVKKRLGLDSGSGRPRCAGARYPTVPVVACRSNLRRIHQVNSPQSDDNSPASLSPRQPTFPCREPVSAARTPQHPPPPSPPPPATHPPAVICGSAAEFIISVIIRKQIGRGGS
ncbi:hypothetical protein J6590_039885 [Homalodisca vitripennis]|nr:hypothetical protein J6590_039885 [Homalodisca vitripennis]